MKKNLRRIVPLIVTICILVSIGWYLLIYDRNFTRDILLNQARMFDTNGNAAIASWLYDLAYTTSGNDEDVAIELASQYKGDGNFTKAEVTLTNAIADGATTDLYIALCKTYVEQDKLLDAVHLLENIGDSVIKSELDALRPQAPVADPEPGFYSQYIPITVSSNHGTLYCNFYGEYPSIWDGPYVEPQTLSAGETTIYAISVADNGLVSPVTILTYTVNGVIEPAVFTDANMEAAVRNVLNLDEDYEIYTDDLWNISKFTVPENVTGYEDLKLLPYVKELTIQNARFDSLSCLSSLSKLESLDLSGSRFPSQDLAVLGSLPTLQTLKLSNCGLSTVADLAGAKTLSVLDLSNNTVRNMDALSSITTLTQLNLQHNAVTSLSALSSLTALTKLDISYNSVVDLSPLASCTELTWLDAGNNSISTISAVDTLPLLKYLSLSHNDLTDITPLNNCKNLTELYISNNRIISVTPLNHMSALEVLDFAHNDVYEIPYWEGGGNLRIIDGSYNNIESIDTLWNMNNLTYIYMDYNKITNVGNLANCPNLVMVNVYGNDIISVNMLTERDIIVNWDPT